MAGRTSTSWGRVWAGRGFRRLLTVRLLGQVSDGLLQVGVAGFVFFSPERAADPPRIAAGLAVLLLPYSLLGPFVGVLLDRWPRRQVLVVANAVRGLGLLGLAWLVSSGVESLPFYLLALVVLGLNRFVLAALGASLPRVVSTDLLVTANSLAPSAGTLATAVGAALGVGLRTLSGGGDTGSAAVLLTAGATCTLAGLAATRLGRAQLGPTEPVTVSVRHALWDVGRGLLAGLRHVMARPTASRALLVLTGMRLAYGIGFVWIILVFRNQFFPSDPDAALAALGLVVLAMGGGVLASAGVTPAGSRRLGVARWSAAALVLAALAQLVAALVPSTASVTLGAALLAAGTQAVKIGVDSTLQTAVAESFRGRVFSLHDLLFNASFVLAAAVAAAILPATGDAPLVMLLVAVGYVGLAGWSLRGSSDSG